MSILLQEIRRNIDVGIGNPEPLSLEEFNVLSIRGLQGVPVFGDFCYQKVIMKSRDHELRGPFLLSNPKLSPKDF